MNGQLLWTATDPTTSRMGAAVGSGLAALKARFFTQQQHGEGYLEVSADAGGYPAVTVSLLRSCAVVHRFSSAEAVSLLVGDASASGTIEVPVQDETAWFDAVFGVPITRAWAVVECLAEGRDLDTMGDWFAL